MPLRGSALATSPTADRQLVAGAAGVAAGPTRSSPDRSRRAMKNTQIADRISAQYCAGVNP